MSRANASCELVILVVEDEFFVRESIVRHLREAGCAVMEAPSGEHAVEMLDAAQPIDALFTDIQLGGSTDGWDVAEACRATWDDVAVIYTSGAAIGRSRCVSGGLFFAKPYRSEEVLEACRNLCKANRERRA